MSFSKPLRQEHGRTLARERVAVLLVGPGTVRFFLSGQIARRLGVGQDSLLSVSLGTGSDFGLMLLAPTRDEFGLHCVRHANQIAVNVRVGYLPREAPKTLTELPHHWRGSSLIVDMRSLPQATTETTNGTKRRSRFSDLDPGYGDRDRSGEESADLNTRPGG